MSAFVYGVALQLKLDIRSKTMLVSCYFIPLIFFLFMGGIFTSVMPGMKNTLIQSMIVMGVSMGSFTGLPLTLAETCGDGIKKVYKANGVPLYMGLVTMFISAFIHLAVMCMVLLLLAPVIFGAAMPANLPVFFVVLAVYIAVSLSVGSILGLAVKNQAKLSMVSQLVFLPSIMLSGIMFPANLLPEAFEAAGKVFPAYWGYRLMQEEEFIPGDLWYLVLLFCAAAVVCGIMLKKQELK